MRCSTNILYRAKHSFISLTSYYCLFKSLTVCSCSSSARVCAMTHITTRDSKGLITISPRDESKQSALIIISHGLGDTAEGFVDVAENFANELPHVKFILPTAPTQPVSMNMGMPMPSWYDIVGLDERSNENCKGIDESISTITSLLKTEHESTSLAYSRMFLMGFSQGGALSLFTGLTLPEKQKLSGICALSAYLPSRSTFQLTQGLESTPVLHCHGEADPLVNFSMAQKSRDYIKSQGIHRYDLVSYPGVQHTVTQKELSRVLQFIKEVLPKDDTQCIKMKPVEEMKIKELKAAIRRAGIGSKTLGFMEKSEFVNLLKEHRENGK